ncbi:MAG: hypothetical protein KAX49_19285 [Halanaerobiales bacterium]|nr:hypothetical protein [Halanaerobiales bacterium]
MDLKEEKVVFGNKTGIRSANLIFIYSVLFALIVVSLFFLADEKSLIKIIIVFFQIGVLLLFFSRFAYKLEFKEYFIIIFSPPFRIHKYRINEIEIIDFSKRVFVIKSQVSLLKVPYYLVALDRNETKKFTEYIEIRKDIKKVN